MNTFDVSLGMNINVKSYINYQPIRFTSKSRSSGKTFFAMEFELVKV